ncbi:MAG TPA: flagellar hook protein FlgE, partial [Fimbriimonadaceae bacterium]|nr:flagellar hook protein FlgE [Fimbriimonadaceae bacterium]
RNMLQALLAGVSSIKAQQTRMNVIGNNLANINTAAYKDTSVAFEDLVSQTLSSGSAPTSNRGGTNPIQVGLGVAIGSTSVDTSQGSFDATNVPSDLAIQGNGYFAVSNGSNISYTRDGTFNVDASGNLVQASTGQRLLGWQADKTGKIDTTAQVTAGSFLTIPVGTATSVQATGSASLNGNLNASAAPTDTWSTQTTAFDSLGIAHNITVVFSNPQSPPPALPAPPPGATTSWDWNAYEGTAATGTPIGSSATAGNQPLFFNNTGAYCNVFGAGAADSITVPASNGASATPITLDFSAVSQLSEPSSVEIQANGFPPGELQNYSIGNNGVITGVFSNGMTRPLGQIALVGFANPAGLIQTSDNLSTGSVNSGLPAFSSPGTGAVGTISAGYLEQSNVDIGSEFTNLIVTQRGFQANTKIVTTVDQMLQDLVNMKQ